MILFYYGDELCFTEYYKYYTMWSNEKKTSEGIRTVGGTVFYRDAFYDDAPYLGQLENRLRVFL